MRIGQRSCLSTIDDESCPTQTQLMAGIVDVCRYAGGGTISFTGGRARPLWTSFRHGARPYCRDFDLPSEPSFDEAVEDATVRAMWFAPYSELR